MFMALFEFTLSQGKMKNGRLRGKVDPVKAINPAWRSRLTIRITDSKASPYANANLFIHGTFKNGKLHGLVQIFGQMTVDPRGHCSNMIFPYIDPILGLYKQVKFDAYLTTCNSMQS